MAFSPDGTRAYVANYVDDTVSVISVATGTVTSTIATGDNPASVAFSPDGTLAYVANYTHGSETGASISVIAVASETVTGTIPVGSNPTSVAFNPSGRTAYVVNGYEGNLTEISGATGKVTSSVRSGSLATGLAVAPDRRRAYVTNSGDHRLVVFALVPAPTTTSYTSPRTVRKSRRLSARVTVSGVAAPTGTITAYNGGTKMASYRLYASSAGHIEITLPRFTRVGTARLWFAYSGSKTAKPSRSTTHRISVVRQPSEAPADWRRLGPPSELSSPRQPETTKSGQGGSPAHIRAPGNHDQRSEGAARDRPVRGGERIGGGLRGSRGGHRRRRARVGRRFDCTAGRRAVAHEPPYVLPRQLSRVLVRLTQGSLN